MLLTIAEIIEKFCSSQAAALHSPSDLKKGTDKKHADIKEYFENGLNFSELARFQKSFLESHDPNTEKLRLALKNNKQYQQDLRSISLNQLLTKAPPLYSFNNYLYGIQVNIIDEVFKIESKVELKGIIENDSCGSLKT